MAPNMLMRVFQLLHNNWAGSTNNFCPIFIHVDKSMWCQFGSYQSTYYLETVTIYQYWTAIYYIWSITKYGLVDEFWWHQIGFERPGRCWKCHLISESLVPRKKGWKWVQLKTWEKISPSNRLKNAHPRPDSFSSTVLCIEIPSCPVLR